MWRFSLILILIPFYILAQDADVSSFPHQLHIEDVELSCEDCHGDVSSSTSLDTRLLPDENFCADCHGEAMPVYPAKLLAADFSHQLHTKSFECQDCHSQILDDTEPTVNWTSTTCQNCHASISPANHDLEWASLHGLELNSGTDTNCQLCHKQETCEQCHQLQQFTPKVHMDGFVLSHAFEARAGILECYSCHEMVQDCYTCHMQNQVMPMNHNFPNWVGVKLIGGGLHSTLALDEPEVCQTCHLPATDPNCLKCH
jgi:hypothetical protein